MWSIMRWDFVLLSLVFIHEIPLERRSRANTQDRLELISYIALTTFAARTPVRLGTTRAGSGVTRAGVYQGPLLISTPGGALRPGSQAGLRCLIVSPDRVSAKRPCQGPPRAGGILAHRKGLLSPLGRGVRCGTLVCPGGYPYCWCEVVKVQSLSAVL